VALASCCWLATLWVAFAAGSPMPQTTASKDAAMAPSAVENVL
jgi:hypothetical protein